MVSWCPLVSSGVLVSYGVICCPLVCKCALPCSLQVIEWYLEELSSEIETEEELVEHKTLVEKVVDRLIYQDQVTKRLSHPRTLGGTPLTPGPGDRAPDQHHQGGGGGPLPGGPPQLLLHRVIYQHGLRRHKLETSIG